MPAALQIDWNHAKLLYMQGLNTTQIAAELGVKPNTVAQRCTREKWVEQSTRAKESLNKAVVNSVNSTLAKRAEAWTNACADNLEETVLHLAKVKKPKSIKKLREYEETWATHTKRGRSTFGLDQQQGQVQVNIGVQQGLQILNRTPEEEKPQ